VFKVEVGATGSRNNPFAQPVSTEYSHDGDREGVECLGDKRTRISKPQSHVRRPTYSSTVQWYMYGTRVYVRWASVTLSSDPKLFFLGDIDYKRKI